jgi:Carbohydrate esterase, sialic acid-specific acetylesterase
MEACQGAHRFARRPGGRRFDRQARWRRAVIGACRRLRVRSSHNVGSVDSLREGATKISEWLKTQTGDPRSTLYGSCMNRMKTVSPANGTVRAVIFWQGGSDAKTQEDALSWKDRFTAFVAELRADLENPDLPIIMVMLGDADAKVALASRAGAAARGEHSRRHQDRGKWIRT